MSVEQSTKSLGSRFADTAMEAEYHSWSIERAIPLQRFAGYISLPIWLFAPAMGTQFTQMDTVGIWLSYGLVVPLLLLALVSSYSLRFRPWAMIIVSAVLCAVGGTYCLWLAPRSFDSLGVACAGAVMFSMFAPFMRLPLAHSLAALLPIVLPVSYMTASAGQTGALSVAESYGLVSTAMATLICACVLVVMQDRSQRRTFLTEATLEKQQNAIRRYVPQAVAAQILDGQEAAIAQPQRRRVTVMFADVVGFTEIADRVEPEVMTDVLSEYLSSMAALIEQHRGTLNEFAGDGLMALFGAPETMPADEQVRHAVQTALAMQAKLPELNEHWRKLGLGRQVQIRIGINTGMVSVGSYGSAGRMTYTAIGLQTNIASRIESAAAPGEILISDDSWQLIRDEISCTPRGEVNCKGVHFPIKVYAPVMP